MTTGASPSSAAPPAAPALAATPPAPARARPAMMTVSPAAVAKVKALLAGRGKPSAGIRIGIRTKGWSGMPYTLEFADARNGFDEVVEAGGVTILIDPKATMFILGTEMDYREDKLESGFTFVNPNEKGRCGFGGRGRNSRWRNQAGRWHRRALGDVGAKNAG